jgi:CSLREA domain-containing protein
MNSSTYQRTRIGIVIVITLVLVAALISPPHAFAGGNTYVVNSTADTNDGNCNGANCTLREAMNISNTHGGQDTIRFDIPGPGPHVIRPTTALPVLTDSVRIVGHNAEGSTNCASGVLSIVLDGSLVSKSSAALHLAGGGSLVRGLVIQNWTGNSSVGILISAAGGNTVECSFIGTNVAGNSAAGNNVGIYVDNQPDNVFGGIAAGDGNVLSGNNTGIVFAGGGSRFNRIEGSMIGTDRTGSSRIDNGTGVSIEFGASDNIIGGVAIGARNIISGNETGIAISPGSKQNRLLRNFIGTNAAGTAAINNSVGVAVRGEYNIIGGDVSNLISGNLMGIQISGSSSRNNRVEGNFIGTDVTGTTAVSNGFGILVADGANWNTIGGRTAVERNVISGNGYIGISIENSLLVDVMGNFIGTNAAGTGAVPNNGDGIHITNSDFVYIGTYSMSGAPGAPNVISGSLGSGIYSTGGDYGMVVMGNFIGTDASGSADVGNGQNGIRVVNSRYSVIGSSSVQHRNIISGNSGYGVMITEADSYGAVIQGNFIGTDKDGTGALGNGHGVWVGETSFVDIGGRFPGEGNLISGNLNAQVAIVNSSAVTVEHNSIGSDLSGTMDLSSAWGIMAVNSTAHINANRIAFNSYGVFTFSTTNGRNNCIHNNQWGVHQEDVATSWKENWWGAANGPSGEGPGSGDPVETAMGGSIDYSNWQTSAPADCGYIP